MQAKFYHVKKLTQNSVTCQERSFSDLLQCNLFVASVGTVGINTSQKKFKRGGQMVLELKRIVSSRFPPRPSQVPFAVPIKTKMAISLFQVKVSSWVVSCHQHLNIVQCQFPWRQSFPSPWSGGMYNDSCLFVQPAVFWSWQCCFLSLQWTWRTNMGMFLAQSTSWSQCSVDTVSMIPFLLWAYDDFVFVSSTLLSFCH